MSAPQARLQIATKIHYLLLREIDHGIDIQQMLTNERYARDVLLVCRACKGSELASLAEQFDRAMPYVARPGEAHPAAPIPGPFAPSEPAALPEGAPPPERRGWLARLRAR